MSVFVSQPGLAMNKVRVVWERHEGMIYESSEVTYPSPPATKFGIPNPIFCEKPGQIKVIGAFFVAVYMIATCPYSGREIPTSNGSDRYRIE
jgi:hypothetical protein